uniref:G protein-coupled receptor 65 n=1 Tax=Astyanax mexicanus TaxID=7994 RepID=A0A8B9LEY8_ASTMX
MNSMCFFIYFFFTLHLVVIVIGIPSNAFSLYVSCQHIKQKNELGIYLFNLALSDVFFIAGLPVWMDFVYHDFWRHGSTLCTICVFFLYTNYYTSAVLLSCIAVDRYLAVVHPLSLPHLRTISTASIVCAVVWILAIIFNAITISSNDIYEEEYQICLEILPLSYHQRRINVIRFIVGFLLPAVVVVFCYWRICAEVYKNQAMRLPDRMHVFKLLSSLLLTICICFGPIHITLLLRSIYEDCPLLTWLYVLYKISVALSTLNCLADPLLYCFITRTARSSVTKAILTFHK